jgi:hypothetical protein
LDYPLSIFSAGSRYSLFSFAVDSGEDFSLTTVTPPIHIGRLGGYGISVAVVRVVPSGGMIGRGSFIDLAQLTPVILIHLVADNITE